MIARAVPGHRALEADDHQVAEAPDLARLQATWADRRGLWGALTSVDHLRIGLRYILTAFAFFLLAGLVALVMRLQLARPENTLVGPDLYNQLFTLHGSTMMFLFAVPIMQGFGVYLVPLMVGARNVAFPRLNAYSYYVYLFGGLLLITGRRAQARARRAAQRALLVLHGGGVGVLLRDRLPGALVMNEPRSELAADAASPGHVSFLRAALTAALGPSAWFVDLSARFFLVEFGFAREHEGVLVALGAALCAVAIGSALASARLRSRARGQPGEAEFTAVLGVALGAFSALVIAAALLPHLSFDGMSQ